MARAGKPSKPRKRAKVKDLTTTSRKGKSVRGGGGGVPGLTTETTAIVQKVGAVGPCFRPTGVVAPCDKPLSRF